MSLQIPVRSLPSCNVFLSLGGVREDHGELALAERHYRFALQLLEQVEDQDGSVMRLRVQARGLLANVRQARGHYQA